MKSLRSLGKRCMVFILLGLFLGFYGCNGDSFRPRYVAVLVDETESFADLWKDAIELVVKIVSLLREGEKFVLIGIDNHGYDYDDIREYEVTGPAGTTIRRRFLFTIPRTSIEAARFKNREVLPNLMKLSRRTGKPKGSDIVGAIMQAAHELNSEPDWYPIIIICSDMVPDKININEKRNLTFTTQPLIRCLFVRERGIEEFKKTVSMWVKFFNEHGIPISEKDFYGVARSMDIAQNRAKLSAILKPPSKSQ